MNSLDRESTSLSFKLNFSYKNNVAEYEALIMGLSTTRDGNQKSKDCWRLKHGFEAAEGRLCFEGDSVGALQDSCREPYRNF